MYLRNLSGMSGIHQEEHEACDEGTAVRLEATVVLPV